MNRPAPACPALPASSPPATGAWCVGPVKPARIQALTGARFALFAMGAPMPLARERANAWSAPLEPSRWPRLARAWTAWRASTARRTGQRPAWRAPRALPLTRRLARAVSSVWRAVSRWRGARPVVTVPLGSSRWTGRTGAGRAPSGRFLVRARAPAKFAAKGPTPGIGRAPAWNAQEASTRRWKGPGGANSARLAPLGTRPGPALASPARNWACFRGWRARLPASCAVPGPIL